MQTRFVNIGKKLVIALFMAVTLTVAPAVVFSANFRKAAAAVIGDPSQYPVQAEIIRQTTPLVDRAIKFYSTLAYYLGASAKPEMAVIGRNGWVFLGDAHVYSFSQTIRRRVLSDQDVAFWTGSLRDQAGWLKRQGIPMIFVVAPSSGTIYPENLPAWTRRDLRRASSFERVLASGKDLPLLDVRADLVAGKAMAPTYSPLNTHWTDFGASLAWRAIAARLQTELPGFKAAGANANGTIVTLPAYANEYEGLAGIRVKNPWTMFKSEEPFQPFTILASDGSRRQVSGDTAIDVLDLPKRTENPNATSKYTALFIRDSMGTALSPFITASFKNTVQVHHHFTQYPKDALNLIAEVKKNRPDVVIYVMTERFLDRPLGDAYYWDSVSYFDKQPTSQSSNWSLRKDVQSDIVVSGASATTATVNIPSDSKNVERAIRISGFGTGNGFVRVQANSRSGPIDIYQAFSDGDNELYFHLAADLIGNSFTVTTHTGVFEMTAITIR